MTPACATLWIGPELAPAERACLRSVVRQGHTLTLYAYEPPSGVPEGVEVRDAAEILDARHVIRHEATGSVSLFSNRFRYELQRRELGIWVDTDVYLLAPLEERDYLLGEQEPGVVACGILRLPPDAPILAALLEIFEERRVPAWLGPVDRVRARARLLRTGRTQLSRMPWGSAGPNALSYLAKRHGVDRLALPRDVFYPVGWREADWVRDPQRPLESVITPRTVSVHLWTSVIQSFKDEPAPAGSFLARLQAEGAAS